MPQPASPVSGPGRASEEGPGPAGAVHGWFTEGFDTADLVEARALLDELAAAAPT
ncbi:MAG: hypothetical protein R3C69_11400 [Geminicoccaceae bacterium]